MPHYYCESADIQGFYVAAEGVARYGRPIYQECDLQKIIDDDADYHDELTKYQMLKLVTVFEQHGYWVHKDAKVILGKMQVGLGTLKFLKRIPGMGAAIFQGPMTDPKATWYQKQVVIRAFIVEEPPAFVADIYICGVRTMVQDEGRVEPGPWLRPSQARPIEASMANPVDAKPGVEVTIAGAINGTVRWSKNYVDAFGVEIKAAMKDYKTFFNRSRKANGEAPIALKFIIGENEIDGTDRRLLRNLWPPSSPFEIPMEPAAKKPRRI